MRSPPKRQATRSVAEHNVSSSTPSEYARFVLGRWALIIGLSMTPALVAGQSAAFVAGIGWNIDPWALVPVVALASTVEGILVTLIAGRVVNIGFVARFLDRLRTPRALAYAERWGVWGGLFLGVAVVGQEPILIALRGIGVPSRRIWLPLALSNVAFSLVYFAVVKGGWASFSSLL